MRTLVDQLEGSLSHRLYYCSLFTALTLPDIGGALDAEDGRATGARYAAWFESWVRPIFAERALAGLPQELRGRVGIENPLTGESCYQFRCSLLHQGTTHHPKSPYSRIIFIEPGTTTNSFHGCVMNNALVIDLPTFCGEVVLGTRRWLDKVEGTDRYQVNHRNFASRHLNGLPPYIGGVPVVG